MDNQTRHVRLGDLLMEAGIITSDYIANAIAKYEEEGLPLGKVLIMSGYLNELELRHALNLQYMINDRLLNAKDAVRVLKACHKSGLSLEDAFASAGVLKPEEQETNKLGQLLIDSQLLSQEQLDDCLDSSQKTGLPLGHILCQRGLLSQAMINRTLLTQQLIRRGQVLRKQGIASLEFGGAREKELEALQVNRGFVRRPLKSTPLLGELFALAKTATERQVSDALLASIANEKTIGTVLIEINRMPPAFVTAGVVAQELLDNKLVEADKVLEALVQTRVNKIGIVCAIAEAYAFTQSGNPGRDVVELLSSAGLIDAVSLSADIQDHVSVGYNQARYICDALLSQGICEEKFIFGALFCVVLIGRGVIDRNKAFMALQFAGRAGLEIDYALYMLGVIERTRLQEEDRILPT